MIFPLLLQKTFIHIRIINQDLIELFSILKSHKSDKSPLFDTGAM